MAVIPSCHFNHIRYGCFSFDFIDSRAAHFACYGNHGADHRHKDCIAVLQPHILASVTGEEKVVQVHILWRLSVPGDLDIPQRTVAGRAASRGKRIDYRGQRADRIAARCFHLTYDKDLYGT